MPSVSAQQINYSILAIPAYYVLSLLPHNYALNVATHNKPKNWDNRCPRSSTLKAKLQEQLGPTLYARYERAEAASANGLENLPLFAAAILAGNIAGLPQQGLNGMEGFAALFLAVRALYSIAYVQATSNGASYIRTGLWVTGLSMCIRTFVQAAKALRK